MRPVDLPYPARPLGRARLARVDQAHLRPPRAAAEVVTRPTQPGDRCASNGKPSSCENFRDAPEKNRRPRAIRPRRPLTLASQDRWVTHRLTARITRLSEAPTFAQFGARIGARASAVMTLRICDPRAFLR